MEYYNNIGMDKKIALYFKNKRMTEYIYDRGDSKYSITVMQRGNVIDVYCNDTGEKLYNLFGVTNFKIEEDGIILYDGRYYSMRAYDGKVILRTRYLSIVRCKKYLKTIDFRGDMSLYFLENNVLQEIIKPQKCDDIRVNENGIVLYQTIDEKKCKGYYTLGGNEIIPPKYSELSFNSQGIYVITHENKKGFCSYSGKEIVPPLYSEIIPTRNCFVVYNIRKNGKNNVGLYTQNGELLLKPRYDDYFFKPPYCMFKLGELYSLYDVVDGKRILPLKYKYISGYYNVIYATKDLKTFTIYSGKTGNKLLEDKFEEIKMYAPFVLSVVKNNRSYYYLTLHNMLIDSEKYYVEYSEEYKEVVISKRGTERKLLFTEWLAKQN